MRTDEGQPDFQDLQDLRISSLKWIVELLNIWAVDTQRTMKGFLWGRGGGIVRLEF
jgi:hypothetical protein